MNIIKISIFYIILSGCMSSGWESPTSKSLEGHVEDSIYYADNDSFEIQTPILQNQKGWPLLKISEQYREQISSVIFAVSSNYYHMGDSYAVLIDRTQSTSEGSLNLPEAVDWLTKKYAEPASKDRLGIKELQRFNITINKQSAVLLVMKEEIADDRIFAKHPMAGQTLYHIMAIQASKNGIANVWIQLVQDCPACASGSQEEILNTNDKIKAFLESFKLKI